MIEERFLHVPKCFVARISRMRFFSRFIVTVLALTTSVAASTQVFAQDWNMSALESAYDDFAGYLEEMGEFSPDDWQYRIGAAVGTVPDFSGSDQYETKGLPIFQIRYKDDVWIDPLGVRVKVWSTDCCRLLAQAGLATGRRSDKDSRVFQLPDVSAGANVGFTFEGQIAKFFAFRLKARQEIAGGHGGTGLAASFGTIIRTGMVRVIPEIGTEWKSNKYMDAYYGVPASATAATGYAAYDPSGGFEDVAFRLTSFYDIDEQWQLIMRGEAKLMLKEAKNAPFVVQDGDSFQGLFGVGVLYTF
ncbi:MAG: MipA/OmpV family protein [Rhodospirillaceae bacterium]|nr:MipA/OmpV family protein [Rhodospirillaceae bacterium]